MPRNNIVLYKITRVIWTITFIIQAVLGLRLLLRLFGANPEAQFTEVVYALSSIPLAPFSLVFDTTVVAGSAMEWSTLLAIVVYGLLAQLIVMVFSTGRTTESEEVDSTLRSQERGE